MSFGLQLEANLFLGFSENKFLFVRLPWLSVARKPKGSECPKHELPAHSRCNEPVTGDGPRHRWACQAAFWNLEPWNPSSQQAQPEEGMSRAYLPLSWSRAWADAPWGQRRFLAQSCASAFPLLKILPSPRCGGCLLSLPYGSLKHLLLREALPDHLAEGDHSVPASVCSASVSLLMFQLHEDRDPMCPVHRYVPSSSQGLA